MQRFEISLETLHVARLLHQFEQQQTLNNSKQFHSVMNCKHITAVIPQKVSNPSPIAR
jgi:hypothetical protein